MAPCQTLFTEHERAGGWVCFCQAEQMPTFMCVCVCVFARARLCICARVFLRRAHVYVCAFAVAKKNSQTRSAMEVPRLQKTLRIVRPSYSCRATPAAA